MIPLLIVLWKPSKHLEEQFIYDGTLCIVVCRGKSIDFLKVLHHDLVFFLTIFSQVLTPDVDAFCYWNRQIRNDGSSNIRQHLILFTI